MPDTSELITKTSPRSVEETVTRLTEIAAANGLTVFAVIDHSGGAREAGLELPDTKVVIVGNPVAGTPVMQTVPEAALDLPLKVLVWADAEQTKVTYLAPDALAARYGIPGRLAAPLARIDALTDAAVGG
jgi:uncharacterized protein (DUF302 family)